MIYLAHDDEGIKTLQRLSSCCGLHNLRVIDSRNNGGAPKLKYLKRIEEQINVFLIADDLDTKAMLGRLTRVPEFDVKLLQGEVYEVSGDRLKRLRPIPGGTTWENYEYHFSF